MTFKNMLLAASIVAVPAAASAQPINGLYIGAAGMGNILQNETIKRLSSPSLGNSQGGSNPKFDIGYGGLASIGYGLGNGLRVELEGNYRTNDFRSVGSGTPANRPHGQEQKYGAMVNALYDFSFNDIGLSMLGLDAVNPYVGIGAGWAQNKYKGVNIPLGSRPGYSSVNVNSSSDMFAYQAIAGVAFPLYSLVPGLSLTAEYRFYSTPNDRSYKAQLISPGVPSAAKLKVSDDFNHSALVGLRYAFDVAPPPPPPSPMPVAAPAPAPSRTYLVFFDWDRADLTARARSIISEAAQNSSHVSYTRIAVNGYTDLSGTAAYNQRLSVRRAEAVQGELVRDGVPKNAITIQGFGETHPLVPTATGVREPQNRRVEIILQ